MSARAEPVEPQAGARAFAGVYTLADDGWPGVLTLEHDGGDELDAQFYSVRFERGYEANVRVPANDPSRIELSIHRFNQMARQDYVGYVLGLRHEAFAGSTVWRDRPYGFFARRANFHHLSRYGAPGDVVEQKDFVGTYTVWHAAGIGTLEIWPAPGGLAGRYRGADGAAADAEIGGGRYAYEAQIGFPLAGMPFAARGYLFTRPKNVVAGTAEWGGRTTGFYMIKVRGADR
jgi:hypothetical protein